MIYCEYKYNYSDYDFYNYAFIEPEDYKEIDSKVMQILDYRTQYITSLFENTLNAKFKKLF